MPGISMLTGKVDYSSLSLTVGQVSINYGNFIGSVLDFLIIAFSIFIMIRYINRLNDTFNKVKEKELKKLNKKLKRQGKKEIITEKPPVEPTTKTCPFCLSEINYKATRCPHCTSELTINEHEQKSEPIEEEVQDIQ